jgi:hypothetical protein
MLDRRVLLERRQVEIGKGGAAVRLLEITADRDRNLFTPSPSLFSFGPVLRLPRCPAFGRRRAVPDLVNGLLHGPCSARRRRVADEVEACLVERHAFVDARYQTAGTLAVLAAALITV